MNVKRRKRRVPKLCHTKVRGIGYYVGFRDPETSVPRKVRFGNIGLGESRQKYHEWLGSFSTASTSCGTSARRNSARDPVAASARCDAGSVMPSAAASPTSI